MKRITLTIIIILVSVVIFLAGYYHGKSCNQMFVKESVKPQLEGFFGDLYIFSKN